MRVRDLIPWNRRNNQTPTIYRGEDMDPFISLHPNANRLFDEVFRSFETPSVFGRMTPRNGDWPSVEFSENDKEIRVVAEVPGLEDNDVEVLLEDGVLTFAARRSWKPTTRIVSSANATMGVLNGALLSAARSVRTRLRRHSRTASSP
ncbi:HSP20 family protein [Mesorhizobium albiziae]|uniref:HSP20 family protein n=1 Tax=Neomesorhizobium albiziae TaxID=335020 RepID=A0A1I4FMT9_9HYPH|nr:HSP20 family protein [Mesorhizobium albiziae]